MKDASRQGVRISIRVKVLMLAVGLLLAAMATYLALAVKLIVDDRMAYAYDLNRSLANTFAAQVRATIESNNQRLLFYGQLMAQKSPGHEDHGQALLSSDPYLLRARLLIRGDDGRYQQSNTVVAHPRLEPLEITSEDLAIVDARSPLPLETAGVEPWVINRSIPPSAQIFTLAVAPTGSTNEPPPWVIVADIAQDPLMRVFMDVSDHNAFLVDAAGRVVTHANTTHLLARADFSAVPTVNDAISSPGIAGGIREYKREDGKEILGAWSQVGVGRLMVVSEVERDAALVTVQRLVRLSLLVGLGVVLLAFIASVFFARVLTAPILRLRGATAALARGERNVSLHIESRDEIGDLASDFQHMTEAIRDAESRLVQSERLAAFGQLGAGITHEIKNPLGALRNFSELALLRDDNPAETREALEVVLQESGRCLDIVQGFLAFARRGSKSDRELVPIADLVQHGLRLVSHQMMVNKIRVHRDLEARAMVHVHPGQIHQVLLNLALNAQDAMGKRGGNVWVRTELVGDDFVDIVFRDDGPGIMPDDLQHIFEPFFTTKGPGEGTGLGLSVSHGLIRDHDGELTAESPPEGGAIFRVRLPQQDMDDLP